MMAAISGGVAALPNREKAWVMPCAKPRWSGRIQFDSARVAVGKAGPSPMPSASRDMNSAANPPTMPVHTVDRRDQQRTQEQRQARPHAIAEPSAGDLEEGIGIGKSGKCDTQLRCGKAEVLLHDRRRRRDIDPIDVENEVHQADR